ncbi:protein FAM110C isoform 1-T3 [Thomomys bottae]
MRALPAMGEQRGPRPSPRHAPGNPYAQPALPARRSAVERLAADRAKFVRRPAGSSEDPRPGAARAQRDLEAPAPAAPAPAAPAPVARRAIARKPLRPDSLVIYRQKCEFVRGGAGAHSARAGLVQKLFHGPGKDKARAPLETPREEERAAPRPEPRAGAAAAPSGPGSPPAPATSLSSPAQSGTSTAPAAALAAPEPRVPKRRDLQRSPSDLRARRPAASTEADTFFKYCGLDPEVVEALGRENFSAGSDRAALKVRSVSMAASDGGFSRRSEEGLQGEELADQVPSATSVVERNARIIKWLYTCRKAKETPGQGLQGPS